MENPIKLSYPAAGVGVLTISRPDKFNAINPETDAAMARALDALELNDQVRCIVITGEGDRAFCAGADIPHMLPHLKNNVVLGQDDPQFCGITHRPSTAKPVLAAVNGVAFGGGLEIALACDMRIASSTARLGLPEVKVGVLAGGGGCTRLARHMPPALAAQMILTGEPIDAQRALQAGLISEVLEPEKLMVRAIEIASQVAQRAPLSISACTALLRRLQYEEVDAALREERKAFAKVVQSHDAQEGIAAFAERRTPAYQNR